MTTAITTARPASPRQVATIDKFRTRKVIDAYGAALLTAYDADPTARRAGAALDYLFSPLTEWLPRPEAAPPVDTDGQAVTPEAKRVYRTADGRIVRLQASRESGRLYGKELDIESRTWTYLPRALDVIAGGRLLTRAEAVEISAQIESCVRCGRTLTATESVERGIGPICAGYFD